MARTWVGALASVLAAAMFASGCSSGDEVSTPTFCDRAGEMADAGGLDLSEDPHDSVARLEALAETAPPGLTSDFGVMLERIAGVSDLEKDDPAALEAIVQLLADEEFASASGRVSAAAHEECGVDLAISTGPTGS